MKRIMKGSIIILCLLIVGLMISVQGTAWAEAEKIDVWGVDDLLTVNWSEVTFLGDSGRMLINGENQGEFNMYASDNDSDIIVGGTLIIEYHINQDLAGTGAGQGFVTILDDDGSIAWEGYWEGRATNGIFVGEIVTQGRGSFEGMKFNYSFFEVDPVTLEPADTNNYYFEGTILNPHG